MSDADHDEKERMEQWRALQIALGLLPEDSPAPEAHHESPRPVPPTRDEKIQAAAEHAPLPLAEDLHARPVGRVPIPPPTDQFTSSIDNAQAAADTAEASDSSQEVELGEAPEEVPDEAPAPGEKRRRRRRRRRRRPGEEGAEGQPAEGESEPEPTANGAPTAAPLSGERDRAEEYEDDDSGDAEGGPDEDDDDDVEPINIPDWNVPTWQELIASLYRPER